MLALYHGAFGETVVWLFTPKTPPISEAFKSTHDSTSVDAELSFSAIFQKVVGGAQPNLSITTVTSEFP